tara:strand:+ start:153 stop:542 length:390 start_codon:yes stop_codon:yes gene_type:complete
MKYFLVFFTLIISPNLGNSAWFKLFEISSGDLYIDTDSIVRDNNTIYFNQLVNYKNKQKNGMLSLKVFSEIDCTTLKIRDLDYEIFSSAMGGGEDFYNGKPKKKWKKPESGSSVHFLNKILCDRVSSKR